MKYDSTHLPKSLTTDRFMAAWVEWQIHRKEIKHKLTPTTIHRQLLKCEGLGHDRAIRAIEYSIEQGYVGIFEPSGGAAKPGIGKIASPAGFDPDAYARDKAARLTAALGLDDVQGDAGQGTLLREG